MSAVVRKPGNPGAWELVALGDLGQWSGGGTPSKSKAQFWEGGTIPWVSPKDMKNLVIRDSEDHITEEAVSGSAAKLIPANSVLFVTRSGILRHSFPVAVNAVPVTVNQDLKTLTLRDGVLPEYVAWALRAFTQDILNTCSKQGTTVNSVETSKLKRFTIPLAPLEQQQRIVAEIEKQFSRLDEAVANLKRVKANLKRYKAAVFKAAVEGKLTEGWRKAHPDIEPASKLLDRILAERRAKWEEAELAKMEAKGKAPKNDKWKAKYKRPAAPDTTNLPELPEGWAWGTFGHLCRVQGGFAFKSADYKPRGIPLVRISNLVDGAVQLEEDTVYLPESFLDEYGRFRLEKGDTLIAMSGATTGKMATFRVDAPALLNQRVGRFLPVAASFFNSKYISFLAMRASRKVLADAYGAAQPNISPAEIEAMRVAVPPLAEQERIAAEVDRSLSVLRKTEAQVDAHLQRAERLRQAILAGAFSGTLIASSAAQRRSVVTQCG